MASIKKFNGTSWNDTKVRKLGTSTDTITTLPADIYADGTNATVGLKGNMSQTGTPSPDNPIQPSETGERTAQLFDKDIATVIGSYIASETGVLTYSTTAKSVVIPCQANTTYTLSKTKGTRFTVGCYDSNPSNGDTATNWTADHAATSITITTTANSQYLVVFFYYTPSETETYEQVLATLMMNTGSTALPYEPYGYKIPISSGGVTTNIYLGSTQSNRQIYKFVLTGNETYTYDSTYTRFNFLANNLKFEGIRLTPLLCTHYEVVDDGRSVGNVPNNAIYAGGSVSIPSLYIKTDVYTTETDFKAYLAQQYAAGTPVTVWYVLATEETGIVNEPIRKIGDYADTVTGISIPTITGKDAFDVDTTLKPSEVELTYTGWHDASVKEWDGSQWQ